MFPLLMLSVGSCMRPDQELNPQPWGSLDNAPTNRATWPGPCKKLLRLNWKGRHVAGPRTIPARLMRLQLELDLSPKRVLFVQLETHLRRAPALTAAADTCWLLATRSRTPVFVSNCCHPPPLAGPVRTGFAVGGLCDLAVLGCGCGYDHGRGAVA